MGRRCEDSQGFRPRPADYLMKASTINPGTIVIVGLGLMGGSLAAACRRKFPRAKVVGVSRQKRAIREARRRGWIHEGFRDLAPAVKRADLVVLCTPVDTLDDFIARIDRLSSQKVIVTDVGSVKQGIPARGHFKTVRFVGAHPMVGSHERGLQAARPDLYEKGTVFLTPTPKTDPAAFKQVRVFWNLIAARTVVMSPAEHDHLMSRISHLPHAVATALVLSVSAKDLGFVSTGFRDTTRIAQSDGSVWVPIFLANRRFILNALQTYAANLEKIARALRSRDGRALKKMLLAASSRRAGVAARS